MIPASRGMFPTQIANLDILGSCRGLRTVVQAALMGRQRKSVGDARESAPIWGDPPMAAVFMLPGVRDTEDAIPSSWYPEDW